MKKITSKINYEIDSMIRTMLCDIKMKYGMNYWVGYYMVCEEIGWEDGAFDMRDIIHCYKQLTGG